MKLYFLDVSYSPGVSYYRCKQPAEYLISKGHTVAIMSFVTVDTINGFDALYICGLNIGAIDFNVLNYCKQKSIKIVLDLDDDVFNIPAFHPEPHRSILLSSSFQKFMNALLTQGIDFLTVTTPYLHGYYSKFTKATIHTIPNCIDTGLAKQIYLPKEHNSVPVIGWAGGSSHFSDLQQLTGLWSAIIDKGWRLRFIGYFPPYVNGAKHVDVLEWNNDIRTHYQTLAFANFDVCIAPLEETQYNLGKSNIKLLEYVAFCGAPVVAWRYGPYREGQLPNVDTITGLDDVSVYVWIEEIERRLKTLGHEKTYYSVPPAYTLDVVGKKWEHTFRAIVAQR